MRVRLTSTQTGPAGLVEAGTEIEHPDAHRLVELGVAEPVDQEAIDAYDLHLAARTRRNEHQAALAADLRRAQRESAAKAVAIRDAAARAAFAAKLAA